MVHAVPFRTYLGKNGLCKVLVVLDQQEAHRLQPLLFRKIPACQLGVSLIGNQAASRTTLEGGVASETGRITNDFD